MLLIYTQQITNRVKYTFNLIFKDVLGADFKLTSDSEHFNKHVGPKLSYAANALGDELFFKCEELLLNTGTSPYTPVWCEHPKDVFALAFFLATRYEEYQSFEPDNYGRFSAKQSYAYKNNCLNKPVINIWAEQIKEMIKSRYPDFTFPEKKYSYTPTIDIDNAYAYLGKA